jgi:hypothetical protein
MYLVLEKHREWTPMSTKVLPHRQRDHGENSAKKIASKTLCTLCLCGESLVLFASIRACRAVGLAEVDPLAVEICICVNWRPSSVETGFQAIGSASA